MCLPNNTLRDNKSTFSLNSTFERNLYIFNLSSKMNQSTFHGFLTDNSDLSIVIIKKSDEKFSLRR